MAGWEGMRWEAWNADEVTSVPWKARIIDTSSRSPLEVARRVGEWIKSNIHLRNDARQLLNEFYDGSRKRSERER
jgi:hypothetical protein